LQELIQSCLRSTSSDRPQFPTIVAKLGSIIDECAQLEYKQMVQHSVLGDIEGAVCTGQSLQVAHQHQYVATHTTLCDRVQKLWQVASPKGEKVVDIYRFLETFMLLLRVPQDDTGMQKMEILMHLLTHGTRLDLVQYCC
jgi:hypothetical protein